MSTRRRPDLRAVAQPPSTIERPLSGTRVVIEKALAASFLTGRGWRYWPAGGTGDDYWTGPGDPRRRTLPDALAQAIRQEVRSKDGR